MGRTHGLHLIGHNLTITDSAINVQANQGSQYAKWSAGNLPPTSKNLVSDRRNQKGGGWLSEKGHFLHIYVQKAPILCTRLKEPTDPTDKLIERPMNNQPTEGTVEQPKELLSDCLNKPMNDNPNKSTDV